MVRDDLRPETGRTPLQHLAEWHHGHEAGFQFFQNAKNDARPRRVDLSGLDTERSRVSSPKLGEIERGPYVNLMRLRDPDRDLVVLAEPQRS